MVDDVGIEETPSIDSEISRQGIKKDLSGFYIIKSCFW